MSETVFVPNSLLFSATDLYFPIYAKKTFKNSADIAEAYLSGAHNFIKVLFKASWDRTAVSQILDFL